jgi:hypothetical protein
VIGVAIVLGCLILGLILGQPSAAQSQRERIPSPGPVTVGRFQVAALPGAKGAGDSWVVVDTGTGQCWRNNAAGDANTWKDFGSPAPPRR